jgi:hypothetical protein
LRKHDGRARNVADARRLGNVLAGDAVGQAVAIPALENVKQAVGDVLFETEAGGHASTDFTVGAGALGDDAEGVGETFRALADGCQKTHHLLHVGDISGVAGKSDSDIVAAQVLGVFVGRGGAASEPEQRREVGVSTLWLAEAQIARELCGDDAGVQRLLGRLTAGEVGRDGERGQRFGQAKVRIRHLVPSLQFARQRADAGFPAPAKFTSRRLLNHSAERERERRAAGEAGREPPPSERPQRCGIRPFPWTYRVAFAPFSGFSGYFCRRSQIRNRV